MSFFYFYINFAIFLNLLYVKCNNYPIQSFKQQRTIRSNYIGSRSICNFDKITFCNEHNLPYLCICYVPNNLLNVFFFYIFN